MKTAIVTGSGGLIGSESARHLAESGFRVIGLDNDMRASFFGETASTNPVSERPAEQLPDAFEWLQTDLMVQEYGRYFDMPTVCFRCGCLTGPNHAGAKLHGFLSYLMRCTVTGEPYTIFGYGGKQVRDNIHSADLVRAFTEFHANPDSAVVY